MYDSFIIWISTRMELLQVLQKSMPQKKEVFKKFRKSDKDLSKFFLQIIKKMKKGQKDIKLVNAFFIELYDAIYHDILFGKIKVHKKVVRVFEILALPMEYLGEQKRKAALQKLIRMKI